MQPIGLHCKSVRVMQRWEMSFAFLASHGRPFFGFFKFDCFEARALWLPPHSDTSRLQRLGVWHHDYSLLLMVHVMPVTPNMIIHAPCLLIHAPCLLRFTKIMPVIHVPQAASWCSQSLSVAVGGVGPGESRSQVTNDSESIAPFLRLPLRVREEVKGLILLEPFRVVIVRASKILYNSSCEAKIPPIEMGLEPHRSPRYSG